MDCLLCLEFNSNISDGIQINSLTWNELNVRSIIEKHLSPMVMYKTESEWLCLICWQILHEFHKFYTRIESAHIHLSGLLKSESDLPKSKDSPSVNLIDPEIVSSQTVACVKQEYKEFETDNDEDYKDEDDIPLIQIRPSVGSALADLVKERGHSIEDPLIKKAETKQTNKRKPKPGSVKSAKTTKKVVREIDTECKTKSDPHISQTPNASSASSILKTTNDSNSPLRYYYKSKINITEYDSFIAKHFKLICNKCQIPVETFDELQHHFQEAHKKKQGYAICCGTKFRDRSFLTDHINLHINPEYFKCEYCPQVLTLRKSFKNHMKTHDRVYGCEMCDKKFMSRYLVSKHKLSHLSEDEKQFPCDSCEKCFASENLLTTHQKVVHLRIYCKLCEVCGQSILNSETFKRHMEKHEGITEPTLSCDICGRLMGSKYTLRKHMKSIHPVDGKHDYICHVCRKISPNKKALMEHIRRVHASGYNHKCTICDKAFKRTEHLKDHMATHTGVGTSKCPWCPKVFNANSSMHLHRKKVHPKEWEEVMFKQESQWLCAACLEILCEFHKFYTRIENVHANFESLIKSEFDQPRLKEVPLSNLLEPQMQLNKNLDTVKLESKELETDNDDNYKDEDDIPLIRMRQRRDELQGDCITGSEHSAKDPLVNKLKLKPKKSIKRKGKCDSTTLTTANNKECVVESKPSQKTKNSSASSLLITDNGINPLRYFYESNMNVSEHDSFIATHFKLTCSKCQRTVGTFAELHQHFYTAHKKKQGYVICCGTQFRKRGMLVNHINLHLNPEYFKCEYCTEVLTSRTSFKIHIKSHGKIHVNSHEKVYSCGICDKKFKNKGLLHSHKLTHVPEEEKKFSCSECNKNFAREHMLTSHQRVVHLKTYSKLCDICGEHISKVESFKRHMEKHEGITQPLLSCEICGRVMGSKHCLSVHMKSIHPEDGKHDYICHVCSKIYPNKIARREHIRRVHRTGFIHKCTICEKAFKRKDYLKDHMATHTGVGLPTCPYCSKTFNSNSTMHQHRKRAHPKEWEEARIQKYSGKLPPNTTNVTTRETQNIPLQFCL